MGRQSKGRERKTEREREWEKERESMREQGTCLIYFVFVEIKEIFPQHHMLNFLAYREISEIVFFQDLQKVKKKMQDVK